MSEGEDAAAARPCRVRDQVIAAAAPQHQHPMVLRAALHAVYRRCNGEPRVQGAVHGLYKFPEAAFIAVGFVYGAVSIPVGAGEGQAVDAPAAAAAQVGGAIVPASRQQIQGHGRGGGLAGLGVLGKEAHPARIDRQKPRRCLGPSQGRAAQAIQQGGVLRRSARIVPVTVSQGNFSTIIEGAVRPYGAEPIHQRGFVPVTGREVPAAFRRHGAHRQQEQQAEEAYAAPIHSFQSLFFHKFLLSAHMVAKTGKKGSGKCWKERRHGG